MSENAFPLSNEKRKDVVQGAVAKFWDATPCDSENSQVSRLTRRYYEEIESDRYDHQQHIKPIMDWLEWNNKNTLEIGTGVGTDARQIVSRGATYHGINVDAGSCQSTKTALQVFGLLGDVQQMSATEMSFESEAFDIVYSFGVLHHIPDIQRAVAEIHRVLRPGGYLLFMVYNRSSINYQVEIRYLRRWGLRVLNLPGLIRLLEMMGFPAEKLRRHADLFKKYGKLDDAEWLSRNTDGPGNPYSVVYGHDEIAQLLGNQFRICRSAVFYFDSRHWGVAGRLLPRSLVNWLGRRWGWHRVVLARRP